jgi:O-Antigen ligase
VVTTRSLPRFLAKSARSPSLSRPASSVKLTSSWIYRFGLFFALLCYADITGLLDGPYGFIIKYSYVLFILGFMLLCLIRYGSIGNSVAPIVAMLLFSITTSIFLFNLIRFGYKQSYSGFTGALIFATALVIPPAALSIDADRVRRHLLVLLLSLSVLYLFDAVLKFFDIGTNALVFETDVSGLQFGKSVACILGASLAILTRRTVLLILFLLITAIGLLLRPSSTEVLVLAVCIPLAYGLRARALWFTRCAAYGVLVVALLSPIALYFFFDHLSFAIEAAESTLKSNVLGGTSTTYFRLAVIKEAFRQVEESSFLFGKGLDGDVTVFLGRELPFWVNQKTLGFATIHSDFLIMFTQAGILGLLVFGVLFASVLHFRLDRLRIVRPGARAVYDLLALSVIATIALIIFISANPLLQYYWVVHVIWFILLISQLIGNSIRVRLPNRVRN